MNTTRAKKFPWISLTLLLVAFASFGWFLASVTLPGIEIPSEFSLPEFINEERFKILLPSFVLLLAVGLILLFSTAFMHPITSFNRFVSQWFKSDTVAFLSVFMMAALAAAILFWLQIFLYVVTILTSEALARIDIQDCGLKEHHAFFILTFFSSVGLAVGWTARAIAY